MSDGGKGSQQRPTDQEAFAKAWERIFGNKNATYTPKPTDRPHPKSEKD